LRVSSALRLLRVSIAVPAFLDFRTHLPHITSRRVSFSSSATWLSKPERAGYGGGINPHQRSQCNQPSVISEMRQYQLSKAQCNVSEGKYIINQPKTSASARVFC